MTDITKKVPSFVGYLVENSIGYDTLVDLFVRKLVSESILDQASPVEVSASWKLHLQTSICNKRGLKSPYSIS